MFHRLLADSNAYFRLARNLDPLLGRSFGEDPEYVIFVIEDLDSEFNKSPRLLSKFYWVNDEPYVSNRAGNYLGGDVDRFTFRETVKFMKDHKYQRGLGVSKVDIAVLAIAYVMELVIISDDHDVQEMARDYDMPECMTSLEVLSWLYQEEVITMQTVKATVQTWRHEHDLPSSEHSFVQDFFEYFDELPWAVKE